MRKIDDFKNHIARMVAGKTPEDAATEIIECLDPAELLAAKLEDDGWFEFHCWVGSVAGVIYVDETWIQKITDGGLPRSDPRPRL